MSMSKRFTSSLESRPTRSPGKPWLSKLALSAAVACATPGIASAATFTETVNHGSVIHGAALNQVDTSGSFVFGVNFGAAANSTTTIGDVTFTGNGTGTSAFNLGGGYSVTMGSSSGTGWGTSSLTQTANTGDADWDAVLGTRRWKNGTGGNSTITLDGLVVGQDYSMQLLLYRDGSDLGLGSAGFIDFDQTAGIDYEGYVEEDNQLIVWDLDFTASASTGTIAVAPTTWNVDLVQETQDTTGNQLFEIGNSNPASGNDGRKGDRMQGLAGLTLKTTGAPVPPPPPPPAPDSSYDGFEYNAGQSISTAAALNGGEGWDGPWENAYGTSAKVHDVGLTYTDSKGNVLPTTGLSLITAGNGGSIRSLDGTFGDDEDGWVSVLLNIPAGGSGNFAGISLFEDNSEKLLIGRQSSGSSQYMIRDLGGANWVTDPDAPLLGEQVLLVINSSLLDNMTYIWFNPDLDSVPLPEDAIYATTGNDVFNRIRLAANASGLLIADELRVGATPFDVGFIPAASAVAVPEPMTAGLAALGVLGLVTRRRPRATQHN